MIKRSLLKGYLQKTTHQVLGPPSTQQPGNITLKVVKKGLLTVTKNKEISEHTIMEQWGEIDDKPSFPILRYKLIIPKFFRLF